MISKREKGINIGNVIQQIEYTLANRQDGSSNSFFLKDCVTFGRPLTLSESYFPQLYNEDLKIPILLACRENYNFGNNILRMQ